MEGGTFWQAAQAFRAAETVEEKHHARVALLRLAIGDDSLVGQRAAETLRSEGLVVIRDRHITQAVV